jgi:putative nucleotidyltransferase with HDIG domain
MKTHVLEYRRGLLQKTLVTLKGETTLGRSVQNTLSLTERGVSRTHARVTFSDERWLLHDLKSSNGTFVNGKRIKSRVLKIGDHINLGPASLFFLEMEAQEQALAIADTGELSISSQAEAHMAPGSNLLQEIEAQMGLLETFLDALPLGVAILNEQMEVLYANRDMPERGGGGNARTLGALWNCEGTAKGKTQCDVCAISHECILCVGVTKAFKERLPTASTEIPWPCQGMGPSSFIRFSILPLPYRLTGKPLALVTWEDITERKRTEDALQDTLEGLRKAMSGTIRAIALTVETRDPYTSGHQQRVADLARAIAKEMELPRPLVDGIRLAGAIHDLGKISVPAEILSRPGRLKGVELNMIKCHPKVGYDILKTIDFPWPVADIVIQHHERIDGSGYPSGLRGEAILKEARVLAVADVVEAMASHRPYRPAPGIDRALGEIAAKRGLLYDPQVVDACLRLFRQKGFTLH